MSRRLPIVLALFAGCTIRGRPDPLPLAPADCRTSAQVTGTWRSSGQSQLGPVSTTYAFGCDCIVEARSTLLWGRLRAKFRYSVAGDTIVVERQQRDEVHFTRDGDTLTLAWPGGDHESLKLDQPIDCANAS